MAWFQACFLLLDVISGRFRVHQERKKKKSQEITHLGTLNLSIHSTVAFIPDSPFP